MALNPHSANEISTDNAEQSVLLEKPENEQLHQIRSPRREIYFISAKIALVLIFIISCHSSCFIVPLQLVEAESWVPLSFTVSNTIPTPLHRP